MKLGLGMVVLGSALLTAAIDDPGFQWLWIWNGPVGADAGTDIVQDGPDRFFLAGTHNGLDMDEDGRVEIPAEGADPVFAKLVSGPGDRLEPAWIRSPHSPGFQVWGAVAPDRSGGVYGAARFNQSVTFHGGHVVEGAGGAGGFLARYDPDGTVMWVRRLDGPGGDAVSGVASDAEGNAYVVGWGEGTFPLDRGYDAQPPVGGAAAPTFDAVGGPSGFVVSYAPDGSVRWARVLPAPNRVVTSVAVSPQGEVWVAGELEGALDVDRDGQVDIPAPADRDGFVIRFDTEGGLLGAWSVGAGPPRLAFLEGGDVMGLGVVGGFAEDRYGPADLDGDGSPDVTPEGEASSTLLARYSPTGQLRWARTYPVDIPADVEVHGTQVALAGGYHGLRDLDLDGNPERVDQTVDPDLESEIAILIVDAEDGVVETVWTAPGPGRDVASAVTFTPDGGTLFATGFVQLTADFTGDGEDGEGWATCEARGDIFVARYLTGS
ncbi:MAG: hypothetical protein HKO53_14855 [Gemmatimonadetes bacterium]|nr:hypothetical protein [Gemmatimonadota bacterium]